MNEIFKSEYPQLMAIQYILSVILMANDMGCMAARALAQMEFDSGVLAPSTYCSPFLVMELCKLLI
jgi:hypothetical protein